MHPCRLKCFILYVFIIEIICYHFSAFSWTFDPSLTSSPVYCIRWHIRLFYFSEAPDLAGPSDLIFTRGNPDEADEDVDSDTDDIDHTGELTSNGP